MRFASLLRTCTLAGTLAVTLQAANQKALIGATRDQVLAQFGEPKSNIVAGRREVLFFPGERVVLQDGRVIEAEEVAIEPPAPPPAPAPAAPGTAATTVPSEAENATPATSGTDTTATATPTAAPAPAEPAPAAPAEPEVFIKSVRPPSSAEPAAKPAPQPVRPPTASTVTGAAVNAPAVAPSARPRTPAPAATNPAPASATAPADAAANAPAEPAPTTAATDSAAEHAGSPAAVAAVGPSEPGAVTPAVAVRHPARPKHSAVHGGTSTSEAPVSFFTGRTYLIALVTILGGIAYLMWRMRQRRLLLQATAVSRSPFTTDPNPPAGAAARFTAEILEKLEWKRFEELVAAYYNKTGVVAARTKSGPASAAQIRISWKGEQRPFACVRCLPHPGALIDTKPIEALCQELERENVRRGYVVSSGKFSVPARDLAEEKHVTLLSGDVFLEKLNALPEAARTELLRDATTGDYTTPSCPACDGKMARSAYDGGWQCPQCTTTLPRGT